MIAVCIVAAALFKISEPVVQGWVLPHLLGRTTSQIVDWYTGLAALNMPETVSICRVVNAVEAECQQALLYQLIRRGPRRGPPCAFQGTIPRRLIDAGGIKRRVFAVTVGATKLSECGRPRHLGVDAFGRKS